MGRMYSVTFSGVSVSAAQDLFELDAPSTAVLLLHSVYIGQTSDAGDSEDEMLGISIRRGYSTNGSRGTDPTPVPRDHGATAASATAPANNTTGASSGTEVILLRDTFHVRA